LLNTDYYKGAKVIALASILTKVLTLGLFVLLTRLLEPHELALVPLVQSIAMFGYALFTCGLPTAMEKHVQSYRQGDAKSYNAYMATSFCFLMAIGVVLFVIIYQFPFLLNSTFKDVLISEQLVKCFALPVSCCYLNQILAHLLLLQGKFRSYSAVLNMGDLFSKSCGLLAFLIYRDAHWLLIGLGGGYSFTIAGGVWLNACEFLRQREFMSLLKVLGSSYQYTIESCFNAFRNFGDSVLVGSLLGAKALALYYVCKKLSDQIVILIKPLQTPMIPIMAKAAAKGNDQLQALYDQLWDSVYPLTFFICLLVAGSSPLFLSIVSGEEYYSGWFICLVLCFGRAALFVLGLETRFMLLLGTAYTRFKITVIQSVVTLVSVFILSHYWGALGVALSIVFASFIAIIISMHINKSLGLHIGNYRYVYLVSVVMISLALVQSLSMDYVRDIMLNCCFFPDASVNHQLFLLRTSTLSLLAPPLI
jgi:O-antigen/teichoic acid export membrane protein